MQHLRRIQPMPYCFVGLSLVGLLLAGCAADPFGSGKQRFEVSAVIVSGDNQVVPSGGTESGPLVVRLQDQHGTGYRDVTVLWKVTQGSGTLSTASNRTDANGRAEVTYTSGSTAGDVEITATFDFSTSGPSASRPVAPVSFHLTVSSTASSGAANDE